MTLKATSLVAAFAFAFTTAGTASAGVPQPTKIARIAKAVFGSHWRTAACIAHYESTDGAHLYNGYWTKGGSYIGSLGPWQIEAEAHTWVDARRLITDWWYAAKVAYRLSAGGTDWHIWATHRSCGV